MIMTREDKAKAYDKAIEKAEKVLEVLGTDKCEGARQIFSIFPELKESEGEKVRKELIEYVKNTPAAPEGHIEQRVLSRWLDWLEKQGWQKPADKVEPFDKYEGLTDFESTLADICIGWIGQELGWKQYIKDNADVLLKIAVKKFNSVQDAPFEQKPANKIQPQFKPGDWIVNNDDDSVGQITKIIEGEDGFAYEHTNGYFHGIFEKDFHLWTIQDAKDGDFLVCPLPKGDGGQVFIFKEIGNREYVDDCIEYYCRVCKDVFYENTTGYMGTTSDEFKPATWEQRTLLIRKMKEAGYEWNPDKKVLKKADKRTNKSITESEYQRMLHQIEVLKEVKKVYEGKTIDNIITQLETIKKEIEKSKSHEKKG